MSTINENLKAVPFDKIVKFGQTTMLNQPLFSVSWILGRFCNYSCSYCWPYARTNVNDFYSIEIYQKTINSIRKQAVANGFTDFHWGFSGGEPTAYKDLLRLVNCLIDYDNYQSIHMTTNLSPSINWWKKWIQFTKPLQRKSITASYHVEHANESEFIDKCMQLISDNVFVTINQVMAPKLFYETYERCKRFVDKGINVTLKPQSDNTARFLVDGYDDQMFELMQTGFPQTVSGKQLFQINLFDKEGNIYFFDQAERFNAYEFNKFEKWQCNSGYQSIVIAGDKVKRSHGCRDDHLGTIQDGFNLFTTAKPCITKQCLSSADSKIPKRKL